MTYALGVKCQDGVLLIADRKLTVNDGSSYEYVDKIYGDIAGVIWVYAGSSGTFELFRTYVKDFVEKTNYNIYGFITKLSETTHKLFEQYKYYYGDFEVLVGLSGTKVIERESLLKHISESGKIEPINKFRAIGTGSPYGLVFVKHVLKQNTQITMEQAAELGYFVIKYIQNFELDMKVGLDDKEGSKFKYPQIHFIPNEGVDNAASEKLLGRLEQSTFHKLQKLNPIEPFKF